MPWPPRSLDLSLCDFVVVWGYIKATLYTGLIASIEELKAHIEASFDTISDRNREATLNKYEQRLHKCVAVNGEHD